MSPLCRFALVLTSCVEPLLAVAADGPQKTNILFITADDLNYDSPGAFGGKIPGLTPNIDRLAAEGKRFMRTHVAVAVCQPSRQAMMTGCFPQTNGATGFYPVKPGVATLQEQLKAAGYHLGILGKVRHLQPADKFPWDYQRDMPVLGAGRDPALYGRTAREFLEQAKASGKPFFLMANSEDPHRPFAGSVGEAEQLARRAGNILRGGTDEDVSKSPNAPALEMKYPAPGRNIRPDESPVPGFIPDLPDVRTELAQYYSSVYRCDQTIGEVLRALEDSGLADSTLVVFLSDNGISMPFAKSNCYLASTLAPSIVRWPGRVAGNTMDSENFISGTDFMPTLLEAAGLPLPAGMDGRSFLPLLTGGTQDGRDHVFTCYYENSLKKEYPMRCLQTARFGYIFNGWADGQTSYRVEPMMGLTFKAMKVAAEKDPAIARRVELLLHRVPEEFFDLQDDPHGLRNLIDDPRYQQEIRHYRAELLGWMQRTKDPLASTFATRISSDAAATTAR